MTAPVEPFLTVGEIVEAVRGTLQTGEMGSCPWGVSTDTRALTRGEIFVALQGERFDGHGFFSMALARGASGLVGRRGTLRPPPEGWMEGVALIEVEDTLYALGEIARRWRMKHPVPLMAITGSNGKTTTKEMVAGILGRSRRVLKSEGNLNNRIGLPLTLLGLDHRHGAAVVEMGMNEPGEIRRLCEIARPQFGLIIQVAPAHLEGLGSIEGVARAKGELFDSLGETDTAVINLDDPWVQRLADSCRARQVTFGRTAQAAIHGMDMRPFDPTGARMLLRVDGEERSVRMRCHGWPCLQNGLAAAAAARAMGATRGEIVSGLEAFRPFPMRLNVIPLGGNVHVIDDTYNANPASMVAALEALRNLATGRRVAVLGDMRELGAGSRDAHRSVGRAAADLGVKVLIAAGEWAEEMARGARESSRPPEEVHALSSCEEALETILPRCVDGDWILVKGSRAMAMERVVEGLRRAFGESMPMKNAK